MRATRQFGLDLSENVGLSAKKNNKDGSQKRDLICEESDRRTIQQQIEDEISRQKELLAVSFEKEMGNYKKHLDEKLEKQLIANAEAQAKLVDVLAACKKEYDDKQKLDILHMKPMLVSWVTEAIYKACTKRIIVDALIDNVIEMLLEKYANEASAKLIVSIPDFRLLELSPVFEKVRALIHPDASLQSGQVRLEDNISVQAIGIVDRLDELRASFIAALEADNEL